MFDIQAALGLVQLSRLEEMQAARLKIAAKYQEAFGKIDALDPPFVPDYATHCWHLYVLRIVPELLAIDRDQFIVELNERNVGTSVHFIPVHNMSAYKKRFGFADSDFPMAQKHFERLISLPLYPCLLYTSTPISSSYWAAFCCARSVTGSQTATNSQISEFSAEATM